MKKLIKLSALVIVTTLVGCAVLQPGADPLQVRVEQTQTVGFGTVQTFLRLDDANRTELHINTGPVHEFAESLRKNVVVDGQTNRLWVSVFKSLDKAKVEYKYNHSKSNQVLTALAAAETVLNQAQQYLATTPK